VGHRDASVSYNLSKILTKLIGLPKTLRKKLDKKSKLMKKKILFLIHEICLACNVEGTG